ncbi:MAG: hypothetical protein J2P37_30000, partial [Ktedonobacteraceae bacterium]|nr:hypothetical protein [Ktedonobacteraceae bacterium]
MQAIPYSPPDGAAVAAADSLQTAWAQPDAPASLAVWTRDSALAGWTRGRRTYQTQFDRVILRQMIGRTTMDKRVQFDFAIEFTNGGGIQGQGFRLDIAGDN